MSKEEIIKEILSRNTLFSQYKEFLLAMGYEYPEFLYESSDEELILCRNYLRAGHTLLETEQFYLERQKSADSQKKF